MRQELTKHAYLFKGLLYCIECNGLITWEVHKGIIYGHGNHYRNYTKYYWATEKTLENQLIEYFRKLEVKSTRLAEWIKKALKESHKDEMSTTQPQLGK